MVKHNFRSGNELFSCEAVRIQGLDLYNTASSSIVPGGLDGILDHVVMNGPWKK
jgi:hypothetical protein